MTYCTVCARIDRVRVQEVRRLTNEYNKRKRERKRGSVIYKKQTHTHIKRDIHEYIISIFF